MAERCPECDYPKQEYNPHPEFDCVNTGDVNCDSRTLIRLRAKLTKLEAERDAMAKVLSAADFMRANWSPQNLHRHPLPAVYDAAKAELEKLRSQGEKA